MYVTENFSVCPKRIPPFYKENTDLTSNASFYFTFRISCSLPVIQHMLAKSLRANRVSLRNWRGLAGHSAKGDTRPRITNTMTKFARVIARSAGQITIKSSPKTWIRWYLSRLWFSKIATAYCNKFSSLRNDWEKWKAEFFTYEFWLDNPYNRRVDINIVSLLPVITHLKNKWKDAGINLKDASPPWLITQLFVYGHREYMDEVASKWAVIFDWF